LLNEKLSLLIVDDEIKIKKSIVPFLNENGYLADFAENSKKH